jgi:hypothetical protein
MRVGWFRWGGGALALSLALSAGAQQSTTTPKLQLGGYEQALRWMEQGQCAKAKEALIPGGHAQPGDEVALSDVGNCYLRAADKLSDPAAAQRSREIGAGWILRAANTGLRRAAEEAVRLYLDGKVFMVDPYEAGKWYTLWNANRTEVQLGQLEFDADLLKQMNATMTPEQWAEARARAQKWRPITALSQTRNAP